MENWEKTVVARRELHEQVKLMNQTNGFASRNSSKTHNKKVWAEKKTGMKDYD